MVFAASGASWAYTGISSEIRTKLRDWAVWQARAAQLAKTGYHTGLIHFVQYFMEESVCMVSEGHFEPVDE